MRIFDCVWILCGSLGLVACAAGSETDYHLLYVGMTDAATSTNTTSEDDEGSQIVLPSLDAGTRAPSDDAGAQAIDSSAYVQTNDSGVYIEPYDGGSSSFDAGREDLDSATLACTLTLPTGDPSCDSCLGASCCSADEQCGSDPDCLSFAQCLDDCETPGVDPGTVDSGADSATNGSTTSCIDQCEQQYPVGAMELSVLDSCVEGSCGPQCGSP